MDGTKPRVPLKASEAPSCPVCGFPGFAGQNASEDHCPMHSSARGQNESKDEPDE